jgi:hypothetical protein
MWMNVQRRAWTVNRYVLILWVVTAVNAEKDFLCDLTTTHVNLINMLKQKKTDSTRLLLEAVVLQAVTQWHGFMISSTIYKRRYKLTLLIAQTIVLCCRWRCCQ